MEFVLVLLVTVLMFVVALRIDDIARELKKLREELIYQHNNRGGK